MPLYRHNGLILRDSGGVLANSADCCCGSGSGGGISTSCCGNSIASTIYGTVSNTTGDAVGMPGTLAAVYGSEPSDPYVWHTGSIGHPCDPTFPCNTFDYLTIGCTSGSWIISGGASWFGSYTIVSTTCSPFELVVDYTLSTTCCAGGGSFRVTWTE